VAVVLIGLGVLLSTVSADPSGIVSGIVVDADGPVAGAVVRMRATDNVTSTAADGRFTLVSLPEGQEIEVTAWADGYYVASTHVTPTVSGITLTLRTYHTMDHPDGNEGGEVVHRANVVTLHSKQVFVDGCEKLIEPIPMKPGPAGKGMQEAGSVLYLPVIRTGWSPSQYTRPPWCREKVTGNCAPPAPEKTVVVYQDLDDPGQHVGRER